MFVPKGFRNIISRVELGRSLRYERFRSLLLVGREGSTVLRFDGPQTTLMINVGAWMVTYSPKDLFISSISERRLSHGFFCSSLLCFVAESRDSLFLAAEVANNRAADLTYAEAFPSLLCGELFYFPPLLHLHLLEVDTNRHMHDTKAQRKYIEWERLMDIEMKVGVSRVLARDIEERN